MKEMHLRWMIEKFLRICEDLSRLLKCKRNFAIIHPCRKNALFIEKKEIKVSQIDRYR